MRKRSRIDEFSRDAEGRDQTTGAPGTQAGRARTAGTRGANVARRDRAARDPVEQEAEGVAGEGAEESGTLAGSVGGTTGTSGHVPGMQAPGASPPPVRGVDPEEARRRRKKKD